MAARRGTTAQITVVKEVTAGTTPATPTMLEMPVTNFSPTTTSTIFNSNQIRAHPFVDQAAQGRLVHAFTMEVEQQGAVHDPLLETFFGGVITSKALKFTDALLSLTLEEKVATGVFNQFTYGVLSQLTIGAAASDTAPAKMSFQGMARTAALDAGATLATAVTPAAAVAPFVFAGATATFNAVSMPVASGSIQMQRQIDPLILLGSVNPREFVPGAVNVTGSSVIPYDDTGQGLGATVSGWLSGFTTVPMVWKFSDAAASVFRSLTIPITKFLSLGRPLAARGMRMQDVNWQALYDNSSATVLTLGTQ